MYNKNSIIDPFLFFPIVTLRSQHYLLLLGEKNFTKQADFMIDFYNNFFFPKGGKEKLQNKGDENKVSNCFQLRLTPQMGMILMLSNNCFVLSKIMLKSGIGKTFVILTTILPKCIEDGNKYSHF